MVTLTTNTGKRAHDADSSDRTTNRALSNSGNLNKRNRRLFCSMTSVDIYHVHLQFGKKVTYGDVWAGVSAFSLRLFLSFFSFALFHSFSRVFFLSHSASLCLSLSCPLPSTPFSFPLALWQFCSRARALSFSLSFPFSLSERFFLCLSLSFSQRDK